MEKSLKYRVDQKLMTPQSVMMDITINDWFLNLHTFGLLPLLLHTTGELQYQVNFDLLSELQICIVHTAFIFKHIKIKSFTIYIPAL